MRLPRRPHWAGYALTDNANSAAGGCTRSALDTAASSRLHAKRRQQRRGGATRMEVPAKVPRYAVALVVAGGAIWVFAAAAYGA